MKIKVVFTGRSYLLADTLPEELSLPDEASLDDALEALQAGLSGEQTLPASCLVSVSGVHLGTLANHRGHTLSEGDELVLIAPVAGG